MRNVSERGSIEEVEQRYVLLDDNTSPTDAFLWAAGIPRSQIREVQFNHVWTAARNPDAYTALWNVCATPAFLAKTTDGNNHPEVVAALRYHSYRLFGHVPSGASVPDEPKLYSELRWAPHPEPQTDLQTTLRSRLLRTPKSRTTKACREIGWLFSDWKSDATV
jgi:hypothetical protein